MATATATKPTTKTKRTNVSKPAVVTYGGTISIPHRAQPSAACSKDHTRPILRHGYLRRRDDGSMWLLATDSYLAVAVKVQGDAKEGWVPVAAMRLLERGQAGEQLSATSWRIQTNEGAVTYDIEAQVAGSTNFPCFEKLGVWGEDERPEGDFNKFGVNPKFVERVGRAVGGTENIHLHLAGPLKPIRIRSRFLGDDAAALLMPIRIES